MRIALGIFKYFSFGGLQGDMRNIALELARRGNTVTIYTGAWESAETLPGIQVECLKLSGWSNHARALDFARKFHQAAGDAEVKVAFNRFGGCDFYFAGDDCYAAFLKQKKGGAFLRYFGRYKIFARLEKEIFSPDASTRIFYISPRQKEDYQAFYHTPEERFIALPPGVGENFTVPDPALKQKQRQLIGAREDRKHVLFMAANWKLKGGDRLLEAFARLPEECRSQMQLHFVGGDGKGEAQSCAARLNVAEYCCFHGVQKNILPFVQAADVLIHPARKEAAGNVIVEALSCGVPVICSGLCGFSSFVSTSGAGLVLPEPFFLENLIAAWQKYLDGQPHFAKTAQAAAAVLPLKGRAQKAADIICR